MKGFDLNIITPESGQPNFTYNLKFPITDEVNTIYNEFTNNKANSNKENLIKKL